MTTVGVPAVAGDTGGAQPTPPGRVSVTAGKVHPAPGPQPKRSAGNGASERKDSRASTRSTQSKPGRPQFAMTDLLPAKPASWYSGRGPHGPCSFCVAKILRRIETEGGAQLRVLHEAGCSRAL